MKPTSIFHPTQALRGLLTTALAAVTLFAASTASAGLREFHFIYSGASYGNSALCEGDMTIDDALFANPGDNGNTNGGGGGHSIGVGQPVVTVTMTVSGATSGNGTFTTADFGNANGLVLYFRLPDALDLNVEWVGQPSNGGTWGQGTSGLSGDLNFFSAGGGAPNGLSYYILQTPDNGTGSSQNMNLISVKPGVQSQIYITGDPVPGAGSPLTGIPAGSVFKNLHPPAINASGTIAFRADWGSSSASGSGIIVGGVVVAKKGDTVLRLTGKIDSLKDPVIDDLGHVAFPGKIAGPGITTANDSVVISNAGGVIPFVKAQEGTQAPDAPAGALWKTFTSVGAPGGSHGIIILGFMQQGPGGITALNDRGVWSADSTGAFHLVLHENTTVLGTRTVKSFTVLTSISGTPGQTHAFNNNAELVSLVKYTDNKIAIVHTSLP